MLPGPWVPPDCAIAPLHPHATSGRLGILTGMRIIEGVEAGVRWSEARADEGELANEALAAQVSAILAEVKSGGDDALARLTERIDGARLSSPLLPAAALAEAESLVAPELAAAIRLAVKRIESYYRLQPIGGFMHAADGAVLGQLVLPVKRVGCYVPGGTAPLFSSLLMTAVPARVAGVEELVVATPPSKDGSVAPEIRFAANLLGIETVVLAGGAQAIAALAYGTQSVPRVDKVVGPGNRYVVEAKRQLFGHVGIEALPGPTETLVIADEDAQIEHVVADLLAQAEHALAQPVLVTTSRQLATIVAERLAAACADLPQPESARESLDDRGAIIVVADLSEAMRVANVFAPEHLCLLVREPWQLLPQVRNAGGVFLGALSMEALGDYVVGPSHVMPTGGTARFASFVNLRDFQKVVPITALSDQAVQAIGPAGVLMARAEGLEAHARAIEARLTPRLAEKELHKKGLP